MESDGYKFPVISFNVLAGKDCEYIKNKAEQLLSNTVISISGHINRNVCKCESAKLSHKDDNVLKDILYKITKNTANCDNIEVFRFKPGDFAKLIQDGCSYVTNRRVKSYYIPLVKITDYEGGEILFESINRIYKLDIGSVISFDTINEDGIVPIQAKHSHEQVTSGEKWVCKLCIRENEISEMDDNMNLELSYSRITLDDVDEIKLIERTTFDDPFVVPGKEYTEKFVKECPDLTMIARDQNGKIVGGMYGGLTKGTKMTNEIMDAGHIPEGDALMVCSMFMIGELIGKNVGRKIANYYYDEWILNSKNGLKRPIKYFSTALREQHIKWMERMGFVCTGKSEVVYGKGVWYDFHKIV
jgi:hypothetical protein